MHLGTTLKLSTLVLSASLITGCNNPQESSKTALRTKNNVEGIIASAGTIYSGVVAQTGDTIVCEKGICQLVDRGGKVVTGWTELNKSL